MINALAVTAAGVPQRGGWALVLSLLILLLCAGCGETESGTNESASQGGFRTKAISKQGEFDLEFATQGGIALPVSRYHNWIVTVHDHASGKALYPATISLSGGMAAHGHGLPSQPRVTQYLGEGRYLVEGMKFNMDGQWFLRLLIQTDARQDSAEVTFDVAY